MGVSLKAAIAIATLVATAALSAQRRPERHPDLQGLWTNSTATPLERPEDYAGRTLFTPEEAAEFERTAVKRLVSGFPEEDRLASDLDETYLETHTWKVSDLRTSLIVDPPDGKLPPLLPQALARREARPKEDFENPETFGLDERCLLEVALGSSNAAPPMVPNPFGQNFYQIVQTPTHVMIFTEVVHDARIIRINGTHLPPTVQLWLGDSIGRWEGDTLVVDTTNFTPKTHFRGSGERLHVVERFTRTDERTIRYRVTADDPDTWAVPWTAEIPFKTTTDRIFEYACHEGNMAIEHFLRGARAQEKRAQEKRN